MHYLTLTFSFVIWLYSVCIVDALSSALPSNVAVAGATGRTGSLVVQDLLSRGVNVVALVRSMEKAETVLPKDDKLTILQCDLSNEENIRSCLKDCDAAVWAATGFSDNPDNTWLDKVKKLFGIAFTPKSSIDAVGIPAIANYFKDIESDVPKVVMLSSAGVSRPSWDEDKKQRLIGASDIPIVRLNPFNILNIKAESEEALRLSGTKYCIFRPCGLNDNWPSGLRPMISQGDVAVGRINRKDAAKILADCLFLQEAEGKTFESFTLEGYPPAESIARSLSVLSKDTNPLSEDIVTSNYFLLQQLLPGEKQDSAALAMGQTYEQLDKGETGRFGKRGTEDAESAVGGDVGIAQN